MAAIPDPPDVLFVRGALPDHPGAAVVGSRKATRRGPRAAEECGKALSRRGAVVVSGLAVGIDGAAHWGVLVGNGIGVAALACGPDIWYPPSTPHWGRLSVDGERWSPSARQALAPAITAPSP